MKRAVILLVALGCAGAQTESGKHKKPLPVFTPPELAPDPVSPKDSPAVLIRGATVMTAAGKIYAPGFVLMANGTIEAVGAGDGPERPGVRVIDGRGKFVTPGIIDTHSHMGVYPIPSMRGVDDGNEMSKPATPEVWSEHAFWPQDPSLWRAVAGGVTTIQVLPGSANLIGGRSFVAKLRPAASARLMRFPGAPQGLKMACGENPKRVYGEKGGPVTRMGNVAGYREQFQKATEYRRRWQKFERDLAAWKDEHPDGPKEGDDEDAPEPPDRDLGLETLSRVLDGKILVHNHCYRADEMHLMLDVAKEFGFKIRSFHHALEAYKLRERLAQEGVASSTWADWWGFKMEALDGVPQNAALLTQAGARAIIHSDSETEIRHLNQEAEKAATAGKRVGIALEDDTVLRWITANPAWALGIDDKTGTLEAGKMADVVVWNRWPFSVYALAEQVFIDGALVFDRAAKDGVHVSDFELGQGAREGEQP
jgi:imidazolonepropionase-like amidohydrolase